MMNWNDFMSAFNEAKSTISKADCHVQDMARLVRGRLKKSNVDVMTLIEMKKELAKFNMHTKEWME